VDLAKRIGVSERTIVNWERGRTKPIKQNFERLEKILGDFPSSSFEIDKREFIKGRQWNDLSRQIKKSDSSGFSMGTRVEI
jgi:transcriptional regulator with XRE-family HTH domain